MKELVFKNKDFNCPELRYQLLTAAAGTILEAWKAIGYGDIHPIKSLAKIIIMLNEILGFFVGGFFISLFYENCLILI